jgi:hypothetical protein
MLAGAEKYTGPRPAKPDVPYLLHGSTLIETETTEAREEKGKKDETSFVINGAGSPVKTPMAEPIFLIEAEKAKPESFELYKLDVKGAQRLVTMPAKKSKNAPRPMRLAVTRIAERLYRIEAAEFLENGQYSLSSSESNTAFCFEVY